MFVNFERDSLAFSDTREKVCLNTNLSSTQKILIENDNLKNYLNS